tara:strand:- start:59 stop:370 length:312 start_codon:yes stop_codon:yes gene_type:complete
MTTKKKAAATVAKNKALISAADLAKFMGLKSDKGLKTYCDAAADVVTAFAETELKESNLATLALLHTAVWLHTSKAKTVDELRALPLTVRYMVLQAKENQKAI